MAEPGDLTVTLNATGTATLFERDFIDATAFGDTTRTYAVGYRTVAGTFEGALDQMVGLRGALNTVKDKRTKEQKTLQRAAIRQLYNKIVGMTDLLSEEMAAAGITADSTSDLISKLATEMRDIEREEAQEKAEWLLDQHLTDEQRKVWMKHRYIQIQGKGANTYRIDRDGNVSVWTKGVKGYRRRGAFCMYTTDHTMPVADKILATKMYLEANEEGYLAEANLTDPNGFTFKKLNIDGTVGRPPLAAPQIDGYRYRMNYGNTGWFFEPIDYENT